MSPRRPALIHALVAAGFLAIASADAAHASPGHRGAPPSGHGGHPGAHHGGHYHGYYSQPYWGWGLALGLPWAWGWYDPWWRWGPAYYPSYAYGPAYPGYSNVCEEGQGCWGDRPAYSVPPGPTTQVPPAVAGAGPGPTERPLHLNYCDSAKAYFPAVPTCPEGWRMTRPRFD